MLKIRTAHGEDLDRLMEIFETARRSMDASGNTGQWIDGYPQRHLIWREIASAHCLACEDETGKIVGTFCFVPGPDPTYTYIEDCAWPDDAPYYVIHRLASDGSHKGIAASAFEWCGKRADRLRVDTHSNNKVMQHLLIKNGFKRCGVIYVDNGTPRIAFQRNLTNK